MNDLTMAMALAPMFAQSGSSSSRLSQVSLPKLEKLCDQLSQEIEERKYQEYKQAVRAKQEASISCVTVEPEASECVKTPEEIKALINGT